MTGRQVGSTGKDEANGTTKKGEYKEKKQEGTLQGDLVKRKCGEGRNGA